MKLSVLKKVSSASKSAFAVEGTIYGVILLQLVGNTEHKIPFTLKNQAPLRMKSNEK
jgi:hypothetical protein